MERESRRVAISDAAKQLPEPRRWAKENPGQLIEVYLPQRISLSAGGAAVEWAPLHPLRFRLEEYAQWHRARDRYDGRVVAHYRWTLHSGGDFSVAMPE